MAAVGRTLAPGLLTYSILARSGRLAGSAMWLGGICGRPATGPAFMPAGTGGGGPAGMKGWAAAFMANGRKAETTSMKIVRNRRMHRSVVRDNGLESTSLIRRHSEPEKLPVKSVVHTHKITCGTAGVADDGLTGNQERDCLRCM